MSDPNSKKNRLAKRIAEMDDRLAGDMAGEERGRLRAHRLELLARAGRIEEARATADALVEEVVSDVPWYAYTLASAAEVQMLAGDPKRATQLFERAVEAERQPPTREEDLAKFLSGHAMALSLNAEIDRARRSMDEAVEIRRRIGPARSLATELRKLAGLEFLASRPQRAVVYAEEAARLFRELGLEGGEAVALYHLGLACSELGRNEQAREALEEALRIEERTGEVMRATMERTVLAVVEFETGNLARALELFDEAQRAQESGGLNWYRALTLINRGVVEHASGDEAAALPSFRRAAEIAEATDNERFGILARFHEAAAMAVLGEPTEALARIEHLTPHRPDLEVTELLSALIYMAAAADTGEASHAERAVELFNANAAGDPEIEPATAHWRIISSMVENYFTRYGHSVLTPTLLVAHDGSWFQPPNAKRVDMRRRRVLRRLFELLVRKRLEEPGTPVSAEELAGAAWPNSPFDDSAANRLYVSINKLRGLGLGAHLESDGGYMLSLGLLVQTEPAGG